MGIPSADPILRLILAKLEELTKSKTGSEREHPLSSPEGAEHLRGLTTQAPQISSGSRATYALELSNTTGANSVPPRLVPSGNRAALGGADRVEPRGNAPSRAREQQSDASQTADANGSSAAAAHPAPSGVGSVVAAATTSSSKDGAEAFSALPTRHMGPILTTPPVSFAGVVTAGGFRDGTNARALAASASRARAALPAPSPAHKTTRFVVARGGGVTNEHEERALREGDPPWATLLLVDAPAVLLARCLAPYPSPTAAATTAHGPASVRFMSFPLSLQWARRRVPVGATRIMDIGSLPPYHPMAAV